MIPVSFYPTFSIASNELQVKPTCKFLYKVTSHFQLTIYILLEMKIKLENLQFLISKLSQ